MSEYEDLVAKILEQKADLNRESLNELVKEKKATVGKGYLQDKGALYLIATDLGISLGEPSNDGISIKDIFSGAKDVSLETRVLNVAKPRQFSRKDGSEFLLRTMTVYDNGGTVSVKLWDEKANLPGIENLKPGDLVRIVKAYVKSDLSGAPTINIGSGSSIEPSDSQSDIRGIDSMSVDVGTIKQHEDKDLVVTGAVDGPIGTINFTNSKGQPGKGLKMRLKGNDESFMRVVVWGQDETNLPPVISHGSVAKLIGVRTKESNQGGLELHGNEGTAIHVDGSHDVQPITARIISVSKTNAGKRMILCADAKKSMIKIGDDANITEQFATTRGCYRKYNTMKFIRTSVLQSLRLSFRICKIYRTNWTINGSCHHKILGLRAVLSFQHQLTLNQYRVCHFVNQKVLSMSLNRCLWLVRR